MRRRLTDTIHSLFGRANRGHASQSQDDLSSDPRWRKLHDPQWTCPVCGDRHGGVFHVAHMHPDRWTDSVAIRPNSDVVDADHVLTEDFCIVDGEHFFVRCVLRVPIVGGANETFGYGAWAKFAKADFDRFTAFFDGRWQRQLGSWPGRIANRLSGWPNTLGLKCSVHPQNDRQRPLIELDARDHPLANAQRDGITFDRLLEIYALTGHDFGDALSQ